ncbi:amidase [Alphaproteobacteria bacterium]|nr:amidase [Alphaproteobacteria bacterium]
MDKSNFYSVLDLLNAYRLKKISPVEHLQYVFKKIEKINPLLNAFISTSKEKALKQAEKSEKNLQKKTDKKLEGVPFGIKDVIDIENEKTINGSRLFINSKIKQKTASVVKKLIDEGAIYVGKLHTHELAIGAPTLNGINKPSSNPWDLTKTAGGSSSGSGSAVGGCLVPIALGTDSGGSIRNPSAMCGIVGLKPTYNSLSMDGVQPLSKSIDNIGPMARNGKDISLVFSVLKKELKINSKLIKDLKIGVIEHFYNNDYIADEEVGLLFENSVRVFEKLGAKIKKIIFDNLNIFHSVNGTIMAREGYLEFEKLIKVNKGQMEHLTFNRLAVGKFISDEQYQKAIKRKKELALKVNLAFIEFDILLTPTNFDLPFEIGNIKKIERYYMRHARSPFNVSGNPSISLPCGLSKNDLPVGFQIVGPYNSELLISKIADEFLTEIDWKNISDKKIYENLYL